MVIFPNCKINLGLRILRKREDGFHDLETIFYPVMVKDILELVEIHNPHSEKKERVNNTGSLRFSQTGLTIKGNPDDNLCIKAFHLLKKEFPLLPGGQIHLHKIIPMGAGLGGGSADGAFTLKLVNDYFKLNIHSEKLMDLASQLGSDCPFFIYNKPSIARGRGELLDPISVDLSRYSILLISPGIPINTAWAYSMISPSVQGASLEKIIQKPIHEWKNELLNDFEKPVFRQFPEIKKIKEELYSQGALYASLTGSGSTVYGIFSKNKLPDGLFTLENYRIDSIP